LLGGRCERGFQPGVEVDSQMVKAHRSPRDQGLVGADTDDHAAHPVEEVGLPAQRVDAGPRKTSSSSIASPPP